MPTCTWMTVRGCLRCLDGVSRNIHRDDCRAGNVPVATVDQLMGTDFGLPLVYLPSGPAGGPVPSLYIVPDTGWGGVGGFSPIGSPLLGTWFDASSGQWIGGDLASPLTVAPVALFGTPEERQEVPAGLPDGLSGSTLQPMPPPPVQAVPAPALGSFWLAAFIGVVLLRKAGKPA